MAFTNDERAQIRLYMGMSKLFTNSNPILEGALNAIEQLSDSGSTENAMRATLTKLATIETLIASAQTLGLASEVTGEVRIDAARNLQMLRKEGTALINGLSFPLSMHPAQRYFYPSQADDSGDVHAFGW